MNCDTMPEQVRTDAPVLIHAAVFLLPGRQGFNPQFLSMFIEQQSTVISFY
jgi:hypothetical protein